MGTFHQLVSLDIFDTMVEYLLTNSQKDLCTNNTGVAGAGSSTSEMNQKSKSNGEQDRSSNNERLQLADSDNDEAKDNTGDDRYEAVK